MSTTPWCFRTLAGLVPRELAGDTRRSGRRIRLRVDSARPAWHRLAQLDWSQAIGDMHGTRFEALEGDQAWQRSFRTNDQRRVCFVRTAEGAATGSALQF